MQKQSISAAKIFLFILILALIYAVAATYYRSFITKNFEIKQETADVPSGK